MPTPAPAAPSPTPSPDISVVGNGSSLKARPRLGLLNARTCEYATQDIGGANTFGGVGSMSTDGSTVVCFLDAGPNTPLHACTFTKAGGLVDIGTLDQSRAGTLSSFAYGVNADGSVVVGVSDVESGANQHAYRWTQTEGMVDLGSARGAAGFSRALATNGDGSVVVGETDFAGGRRRAFVWTQPGGFVDLDPSGFGLATSISADGSSVVGANNARAFRWTQTDGLQALPTPAGRTGAAATGVSNNGKVVVGMAAPRPLSFRGSLGWDFDTSDTRAFRWSPPTGTVDLGELLATRGVDVTGITIVAAFGVSPDGQFIAGALTTASTEPNRTYGFVAQVCDDAVDACLSLSPASN